MAAIWTGQESIPQQVDQPVTLTAEDVGVITEAGWISPEESQRVYDANVQARIEEEERKRLALMLEEAERNRKAYYEPGGTGYGTTPGGPDVTYWREDTPFVAPLIYETLDPIYGEGGILEPVTDFVTGETDKSNLLLYAALGIGALALLKR